MFVETKGDGGWEPLDKRTRGWRGLRCCEEERGGLMVTEGINLEWDPASGPVILFFNYYQVMYSGIFAFQVLFLFLFLWREYYFFF